MINNGNKREREENNTYGREDKKKKRGKQLGKKYGGKKGEDNTGWK